MTDNKVDRKTIETQLNELRAQISDLVTAKKIRKEPLPALSISHLESKVRQLRRE